MPKTLAILIACLMVTLCSAQHIRHYTTQELLHAHDAFHVVKDQAGFLWFCTDNGVVRYDGITSFYFTQKDGIPGNVTTNIYQDKFGRVWLWSVSGRVAYIAYDSVHNAANDTLLAQLQQYLVPSGVITRMVDDQDSGLYIFNVRGVGVRVTIKSDKLVLHKKFFSASNYVSKFKVVEHADPNLFTILAANKDFTLITDATGIRIDKNGSPVWQIKDPNLSRKYVVDLYLTENGKHLLVSTLHGLIIINIRTKEQRPLFSSERISSCTEDYAGNIWVTTLYDGIYRIQKELFEIKPLPQLKGKNWINVNGNFLINLNEALYSIRPSPAGITLFKESAIRVGGSSDIAYARDNLLALFEPLSDKINLSIYRTTKDAIVKTTLPDYTKKMFHLGGDLYFTYGSNRIRLLSFSASKTVTTLDTLLPQRITASAQNTMNKDVYWISGDHLYRYVAGVHQFQQIATDRGLDDAKLLYPDGNRLLIFTSSNTYFSCSLSGLGKPLTTHQFSHTIQNIIPFGSGASIWTSYEGAWIVPSGGDPALNGSLINYPFSSSSYESLAVIGDQCLLKINGSYYSFDTAIMNKAAVSSGIYLQSLRINNKKYRNNQKIEFYNTSKVDVQIGIGLIDFDDQRQGVRYKIISDKANTGTWSYSATSTIALVLGKPGNYRIIVQPNDNRGNGSQSIVVHLLIHPPFFRSVWFMIICYFAGILICSIIFIQILRTRRRRFEKETSYLKLEHKAVNALLNPHFVFNAINNIQNLVHKAKADEATEYLAILSHMIRQNLENLQCNLISLENELSLIERYVQLQNLRFGGNIRLHTELANDDLHLVYIPPLLLHTFVENAIIHGYPGRNKFLNIHISVALLPDDYLSINIKDDGIGFNASSSTRPDSSKRSFGIAFNQKRLDRLSGFYKLNQSITISDLQSTGGKGTGVHLVLYARLHELMGRDQVTVH